MINRATASFLLMSVLALASMAFCQNQGPTPGTNAARNSPDGVLFERATQAIKASHYAEARTLLERLILSYPNSDYVARAKFSIADAWYAEGALQRALMEYQDFVTFFPNRPEAVKAKQNIEAIQKRART